MKLAIVCALLFFSATLSLAAPNNERLRIGLTQEFDNLNPIMTNMVASFYLLKMVNRSFMYIDEKGRLEPQIVESVPTLENKDAKLVESPVKKITAIWKIRQTAKWGDGTPVTCEDLKFTVKVAMSGKVPVPNLTQYSDIEKIEAQGKNRKICVITYAKAKWDFNRVGRMFLLPKHIEEPVFDKYKNQPQGYENNSNYSRNPTMPGLFNGPYKITELKLGSHIVMERNPHFYGEKAKIKKVILKLIPNTATLEANLISGTIDMVSLLGFTMDQAFKFEERVREEGLPYLVNYQPSFVYEHIDINMEDEILKDKKVRQALLYATNRRELSDVLFKGKQPPALHFVSPQDPWYTEDPSKIKTYPYSLRKAKKLLKKAGWQTGQDGYLYKKEKKLQLTIMTTAGRKVRELVEQYLKNQWKKVGVEVIIQNFPPRVFFGEHVRKAQFSHLAMYSFVSDPEQDPKENFHSQYIPRKENNYTGINRMKWKNSKVDELIEKMSGAFYAEERVRIAHEIQKHYTEDVPAIPLFYRSDISVTPKNLKGYSLTGNSYTPANQIESWSLE